MPDRVRRVALVGCGRWGRFVLRDLRQLGCEVLVADPAPAARAASLEAGAALAVASCAELPGVDGAVVCTPTRTHAAVVDALLARGCPVFCEKPLTDDPLTAESLARRAPERLFVMHKWRYHPGVEALGVIARSGELGGVIGLSSLRLGWDGPHADSDAVWILAPHDLSIACEVLGAVPEPRIAVAERFGAIATGLIAVLGTAPWLALQLAIATSQRRRELRLVCESGTASLKDPFDDHIEIVPAFDPRQARVPAAERRTIASEPPLLRELRAFVLHLGGGPPPRSSAAEGAAVVRAIARLRELAGLPSAPYLAP